MLQEDSRVLAIEGGAVEVYVSKSWPPPVPLPFAFASTAATSTSTASAKNHAALLHLAA